MERQNNFEVAHGILITGTHDLISRLLHDLKIKHARWHWIREILSKYTKGHFQTSRQIQLISRVWQRRDTELRKSFFEEGDGYYVRNTWGTAEKRKSGINIHYKYNPKIIYKKKNFVWIQRQYLEIQNFLVRLENKPRYT